MEDASSPTSNVFISLKERDERLASGEIVAVAPKTFRKNRTAKFAVRGFSARHGDYLEFIRHEAMGKLLMSEITKRPMEALT